MRLDRDTVEYFKTLAVKTGLPYQSLINLYLRDCAVRQKELSMRWALAGRRTERSTSGSAPTKRRSAREEEPDLKQIRRVKAAGG